MTCTPQDFLRLAKKLSSSADEIERRTAVSRAYYFAFHQADQGKDILPESQYDDRGYGSHEAVIRRYLSCRDRKDAVKVGYVLRDMKNRRESADYELDGQCHADEPIVQIAQAERIQSLLELLATPPS